MVWFKQLLIGLMICFAIAFGIIFTIKNSTVISLDLIIIQLPELSISLWLLLALLLGALLGLFISSSIIIRLKARVMQLQRENMQAQKELVSLHSS